MDGERPTAPSQSASATVEPVAGEDGLGLYCQVYNAIFPDEQRTVDGLRRDARIDADVTFMVGRRDGRPAGIAAVMRSVWMDDDGLLVGAIGVLAEERGHGLGRALLGAAIRRARERGGSRFRTWVRESESDGMAFAERHGFETVEVSCPVLLRLADADLGDPELPRGIELRSLDEHPELDRALYDVRRITDRDIPSGTPSRDLPFAEWRSLIVEHPGFLPSATLVAFEGDQPVGFAALRRDMALPGRAWHTMTAVLPSHRGRGLGEQLKRAQIQRARAAGLEELLTFNHETNAPMRAINARLGYQPQPRELTVQRAM